MERSGMSGRNAKIAVGLLALVSLALLIAGGVMLGIGISKANKAGNCASDRAPVVVPTTTTPTVCPPAALPTPYFVTVTSSLVKAGDLQGCQ